MPIYGIYVQSLFVIDKTNKSTMTTECGKNTNDYVRYLEGKVEKLVKEARKLKSEAAHVRLSVKPDI